MSKLKKIVLLTICILIIIGSIYVVNNKKILNTIMKTNNSNITTNTIEIPPAEITVAQNTTASNINSIKISPYIIVFIILLCIFTSELYSLCTWENSK